MTRVKYSVLPNSETYYMNPKQERLRIDNKDIDCTCSMYPYWSPDSVHYNCYSFISIGYLKFYDFFRGAWNKMGLRRVRQGIWIEYYPNHKPRYKGLYYNGLKYGTFVYYKTDGSIDKTVEYNGE